MNKSESKYYNTALLMDNALLLLLEKKEYEFITVKEICKKAGVNRSTFYLHYESIDDLLYETIEMVNKRFHIAFDNEVIDPNKKTKDELFLIEDKYIYPYLNFIKENSKIYKLIQKQPYLFGKNKIFNNMYNNIFSIILDKYGVKEKEKEYIFSYFSSGLISIILKWIEKDCIEEIEFIANIIKRVIRYTNEN